MFVFHKHSCPYWPFIHCKKIWRMNNCCITLSRGVRPLLGICVMSGTESFVYEFYDSWLFTVTGNILQKYQINKVVIAEEQEMLYQAIKQYNVVKVARRHFETDNQSFFYGMLAHKILCDFGYGMDNGCNVGKYIPNIVYKAPNGRMLIHKNTIKELKLLTDVFNRVKNTTTKMGERYLKEELCQPHTDTVFITSRHRKTKFLRKHNELKKALERKMRQLPDINQIIHDILFEQRIIRCVERFVLLTNVLMDIKDIFVGNKDVACEDSTEHCRMSMRSKKGGKKNKKTKTAESQDEIFEKSHKKRKILVDNDKFKHIFENEIQFFEQLSIDVPSVDELVNKEEVRDGTRMIKHGLNVILDLKRKIFKENMQDISLIADEISKEINKPVMTHFDNIKGYVLRTEYIDETEDIKIIGRNSKFMTFSTYDMEKLNMRARKIKGEIEQITEDILMNVVKDIQSNIKILQDICDVLSELDLILSFVNFSKKVSCCIPEFGNKHVISNTYNLVVRKVDQLVTIFSCKSLNKHIITGPNMGGKTTYLKTIAVASILSQIGSPLNAESAEIKIYNQMLTKLSQNDNFDKETELVANILTISDEHTLTLLDELGRCTDYSTGLSFTTAFVLTLEEGTLFLSTHFLETVNYLKHVRGVNFVGINGFKARSGVCGYFGGIELAKNYFPRKIIEYAQAICDKHKVEDCNKIKTQVALKIIEQNKENEETDHTHN